MRQAYESSGIPRKTPSMRITVNDCHCCTHHQHQWTGVCEAAFLDKSNAPGVGGRAGAWEFSASCARKAQQNAHGLCTQQLID